MERIGSIPASGDGMRLVCRALVLAILALSAAGCGNGSSSTSSPTPTSIDLTGTWSGNLTFQGVQSVMTWTVTQSGRSVTGPVLVALPNGVVLLNGQLSGTMAGSTLTYTIQVAAGGIPSEPSCAGKLGGTATVTTGTPSTLAGAYSVVSSSCSAPISGGSYTLTRQ